MDFLQHWQQLAGPKIAEGANAAGFALENSQVKLHGCADLVVVGWRQFAAGGAGRRRAGKPAHTSARRELKFYQRGLRLFRPQQQLTGNGIIER